MGRGVTREVGKDFVNRGLKRILLLTDNNLLQHLPFSTAVESLSSEKVEFDVFSEVSILILIHERLLTPDIIETREAPVQLTVEPA